MGKYVRMAEAKKHKQQETILSYTITIGGCIIALLTVYAVVVGMMIIS